MGVGDGDPGSESRERGSESEGRAESLVLSPCFLWAWPLPDSPRSRLCARAGRSCCGLPALPLGPGGPMRRRDRAGQCSVCPGATCEGVALPYLSLCLRACDSQRFLLASGEFGACLSPEGRRASLGVL